jgi:AcrR family transcriptional regulator
MEIIQHAPSIPVKSTAHILVRRSDVWHNTVVSTGASLRARVRAEILEEIKDEARRQVAEAGAPGLSLRAVARALGMVSSGIYRYYSSRDELLTALIIDAYDALGAAAESADSGRKRDDFAGRWRATCMAIRNWALANPNEYALLFGSPVPGYRAPEDTVGPASRVTMVLAAVARDAAAAGALVNPFGADHRVPLSKRAAAEARRASVLALQGLPDDAVIRAVAAWTQIFGFVSFELFGHFENVLEDREAVFQQVVTDVGTFVGVYPATKA